MLTSRMEETPLQRQQSKWSKTEQRFVAVEELTSTCASQDPLTLSVARVGDLETQVDKFSSVVFDDLHEFVALRCVLSCRVLRQDERTGESVLPLLPTFLSAWWLHLNSLETRVLSDDDAVAFITELTACARALILIGDIVRAREALGRSVQLARRMRLATEPQVTHDAKTILIQCGRFLYEFKRCRAALERPHAAPMILRAVLTALDPLQQLAPYATSVMALKVAVLQRLHRHQEVMQDLAAFPLTDSSATLTLAYVRALECEGFYQESIAIADDFIPNSVGGAHNDGGDDDDPAEEEDKTAETHIAAHSHHLRLVLAKKSQGDGALVQSQYQDAATAFSDALRITCSDSHTLRAALRFGRANALIGLERLLSARADLRASLGLDPTNQLARMRLRTVALTLETHAFHDGIHRRMDL